MLKKALAILLLALMALSLWPAQAESQLKISWQGTAVDLKTPGSWQSVIRTGGKEMTVPSSELSWASTADVRRQDPDGDHRHRL